MSTQHPDNVTPPFFAQNAELEGEDEIQEAYYVFSHLGCDEQMWDCEGKEVDNFVVKKLLAKYGYFFSENVLGKDLFLTLRVPNPAVQKTEAKILLETLESIPRSFDAARAFYQKDVAPIFEVILPMTTSSKCVERVYRYYSDFVVGKQNSLFRYEDLTIAEWIGKFKPENINVIPLFEDMERILNAHNITREYLQNKKIESQRVFLARSDPAMNYGLVSAVLLNKIALSNLHRLPDETGVDIYPIIGVGSAPFRGGLTPEKTGNVQEEYRGTHTFTVQSAFKYDYPAKQVSSAVEKLSKRKCDKPMDIDEKNCLEIIERYSSEYKRQVALLAPLINEVAKHVPSRRKRVLHTGLFGYARNVDGIKLPRAIKFTSALYSMGVPPELLGLNALGEKDVDVIRDNYIGFDADLKDSLRYFNRESLSFLPPEVKIYPENLGFDVPLDEEHKKQTGIIMELVRKGEARGIEEHILRAAHIRKFLG